MKKLNYIFLLIILFACQSKGLKTELEYAYTISAKSEKDTLRIESFKILKKRTVDFDFVQNIKVNNLKHTIYLNKLIIESLKKNVVLYEKNISNRNRLINLNTEEKDQYLVQLEYDQQKVENSKFRIKKRQDEITITHQKIVLIQAGYGQNQNEYELIDYIFKGEINGVNRIDSMSILKVSEKNLKFIKNNRFSDYKGK